MTEGDTTAGALKETTVFLSHFKDLPDYRQKGKVAYPLEEVLLLLLAAALAGAETVADIAGGPGTGKSHLSIAITANCIRKRSARARFFNVVDLVNRLEAEARAGVAGRLAEQLTRVDLVVLDELGYLPFAQSGGQLLFHLISRLWDIHLTGLGRMLDGWSDPSPACTTLSPLGSFGLGSRLRVILEPNAQAT